jgi:mono/diheme cytochrome c family protein
MRRLIAGAAVAVLLWLPAAHVSGQAGQTERQPAPAADAASQRKLVDQYCVGCHNARLKTANLLLDQLDLARLGDHPEIGEKVIRKLRAGMMPPTGVRRADAATLESLKRGVV